MFVSISLIILLFGFGKSEFFTGTDSLKNLIYTQEYVTKSIEKFISAKESKIEYLRRYREIYELERNEAVDNPQLFIENRNNIINLFENLSTQIKKLINTDVTIDLLKDIKLRLSFPSDEDLNGASLAVNRITFVYLLNISLMANGELNGVTYRQKLSAADCFEMGRQSYLNEKYNHSFLWLQEAKSKLREEAYSTIDEDDILEYLALVSMVQNNISSAANFNKRLLKISPNYDEALRGTACIEESQKYENRDYFNILKKSFFDSDINEEDRDGFHKLCRERFTSQDNTHKLKCKYFDNNVPFLFLAPFKMEEAYLDPEVYLFHDVIEDREIETLQQLAHPTLRRASVYHVETKDSKFVQYRIGKVSDLADDTHKYIADLSKRIKYMTGLTVESAEPLQVINYGVAGHYEPHHDSHGVHDPDARIATVLFYMSDVSGGATVFPNIGVSVRPKKGTAVVWFNHHNSGDDDVRTIHAACPVLVGSKWAVKFLHEKGQEFHRPCSMKQPPMNQRFNC